MVLLISVLVVGYFPLCFLAFRHGRYVERALLRDEWKRVQAHTEQVLAREMYQPR